MTFDGAERHLARLDRRAGRLWTDLAAWHGPKDLARQYVEEVAAAFECEVRRANEGSSVYRAGKALRIGDVLDRLQAWVPAMQNFIGAVPGMMPREVRRALRQARHRV